MAAVPSPTGGVAVPEPRKVVALGGGQPHHASRFPTSSAKRTIDLATGVLLATLLAVLIVPLGILIKIGSPGPAIIRQPRVGQHGRVFQMYKLRSMRSDAEADGVARWAQIDDPRITPIGRILRKTRLDELPQAINVLRGDMAVVGPRPERPEWIDLLGSTHENFHLRHNVRPGITGMAQVHHCYTSTLTDWEQKLLYDLHYVRSATLGLELLILLRTVAVVLNRRGL
ncbi:sugar transferase [Ornithinimicrobium cryptoxanthini]|uniref:Sugar transferase n=1 Tax=Ornithinimicrobium cryptoxanthini TaxID=2934161 RepID=A0ABY4YH71_9MICO|nr:sugar transferase [Ornithinimicrobium cryptoxanthini]USQ76111.1 sugar transferase [Ornithinimicrobium cryptoxanthini]